MALTISSDDLRKVCRFNDPDKFQRWLAVNGFPLSKDYSKTIADNIAWRFEQKINWNDYKIRQRPDSDDGPLRRRITWDVADKIEHWYTQLIRTTTAPKLGYDSIIGMVCAGGFLEGGDGQEFVLGLNPSMNVLIGDRGSGKSTVLNLFGMLAGSLGEETGTLAVKLLHLAQLSIVERSDFERRVRRALRDYGVRLFASFFCRNRNTYCCVVAHDNEWAYEVRVRQDHRWVLVDSPEAILNFPLQFLRQGEATKISESSDKFYLNKIIDSLCDELYQQRTALAQKLKKLNEQYFHYEKKGITYDFRNVEDFIRGGHAELQRIGALMEEKANRFRILDTINRWINIYDGIQKPKTFSNLLSLLETRHDEDLRYFCFAPAIDFLRSYAERVRQIQVKYRKIVESIGPEEIAESARVMDKIDEFERQEGREIQTIIQDVSDQLDHQLALLSGFVQTQRKIQVDLDDSLQGLIREYCKLLEAKIAVMESQEAECKRTTQVLSQDKLELRIYTQGFTEEVARWQDKLQSLGNVGTLYGIVHDFSLSQDRNQDIQSLDRLASEYGAILDALFDHLDALREWDVQQAVPDFLFEPIEIELKQGETYRGFQNLSFGQKCGIILKLVLRSDDTRILILDQPEDHLDAYSIVRIIAPTIQKLAQQRQVILATHNSTLVLALNPDSLTVLEPRGERGRIRVQGSLSEREVVKEMLDILEGREETFKLKTDLYEAFVERLDSINDANIRLIDSSFRRRTVEGLTNEREYFVLVADNDLDVVKSTIRNLDSVAKSLGIRLRTQIATSGKDVLDAVSAYPIDSIFLEYRLKGGINGDEIIEGIRDPFGDMLIILMSNWKRQELERVLFERHRALGERLKFLRKRFDDSDLLYQFYEMDNYFLGRPYPFPLAYAMRLVTSAPHEQARLTALKDVVETIVKYVVIVLLSDLARSGGAKQVKFGINWGGNLTLGTWLGLLKDLLGHFAQNRNALFMSQLFEIFPDGNAEASEHFRLLTHFKDALRDPIIGHALTLDEGAYALLAKEYENPIRSLYDSCSFMSKYHLILVENIDHPPASELNEYQSRVLMGSEIRFNLVSWSSRNRLSKHRVYLRRRDGEVLPLYPFLAFETCQDCMKQQVFLLDNIKRQEQKMVFNSFCPHRILDKQAMEAFNEMFMKQT